jgi:high-affinity iron transporter
MFNLTPAPSVLECVAWVAYAVPVLFLFLRPAGKRDSTKAREKAPETQSVAS